MGVGVMKHVLIFLMRVLIFHAILICKLYVRNLYHLEYTLDTQLLLSSLQMCLVCSGIVLYRVCLFIVYTINDGRYYNTVDDGDREMGEKDEEIDDAMSVEQSVRVDTVVFADASATSTRQCAVAATVADAVVLARAGARLKVDDGNERRCVYQLCL